MLHRLFRLRAGEARPFTYLFIHAFFNGLGVAMAYTAINIIVIKKQGIEILPWLYLATSVLVILAGVFYNRLEHAYSPKRVFVFSLSFCILWAFAMRFLLGPDKSLLFVGIAYGSYYLILVLTNLDLWGSAALVFNVRQSKRLFGPLSFSESIGTIAGFSLAPAMTTIIAVQDIMIFSGVSFFISLIVLYSMRNQYLQVSHDDSSGPRHAAHEPMHHEQGSFWSSIFRGNDYIKQLSILILISTLIYYTLTYGFLSRVEVQFTELSDIAWFIGLFLGIAKVLNLVTKFLISSHVFTRFGVAVGLYVLPIVVIIVCLIGLCFVISGNLNSLFYIYLFSALYFFDKLLRSSLTKPSFLILFQPLTPAMRLSGHTITKGFFEPLAMGLAGLIIVLAQWIGWFSLQALVFYILVLSVFWVLASYTGVRHYMTALHQALRNRLFGSTTFKLSKNEINLIVDSKLNSPADIDRLYALTLLGDHIDPELKQKHFTQLLNSTVPEIVLSSLKTVEDEKLNVSREYIEQLLDNANEEIRTQAAYTYAAQHDAEAIPILNDYIQQAPEKNNAFIGALIKHAGLRGTLAVGQRFIDLTTSNNPSDRMLAAVIADKTDNPEFDTILIDLVNDPDEEVAATAIRACGPTATRPLVETVIRKVDHRHLILPIKRCVETCPGLSEEIIASIYFSANRTIKRRLLELCSKIETKSNVDFLVSQLKEDDPIIYSEAIDALYELNHDATDAKNVQIIKSVVDKKLNSLSQLVSLYNKTPDNIKLNSGLKNEIYKIYIPQILRLLTFLHNRDSIEKIDRNLKVDDPTNTANAIELLENILSNKWSNLLVPAIESVQQIQGTPALNAQAAVTKMMDQINNGSLIVSDYLIGLVIRTFSDLKHSPTPAFLEFARMRNAAIITEEINRMN